MRHIMKKRTLGILVLATGLMVVVTGCETTPQSSTHGSTGMGQSSGMAMANDRIMAKSLYSFDETVSRIKDAIGSAQMMVVFTADHQAMLSMAGLNTKGMQGIEFFHPRYGKMIMQNDHRAGIEIPLRLVVMETPEGKAMLSFYKPSSTFAKYKGLGEMARELDGVYDAIVETVSR